MRWLTVKRCGRIVESKVGFGRSAADYGLAISAPNFDIRSITNSLIAGVAFSNPIWMSFFFAGTRSAFGIRHYVLQKSSHSASRSIER